MVPRTAGSIPTPAYSFLAIVEPMTACGALDEELGERLAIQMVAEAIRCLSEGILRNARDGDIGAIFGLGFPPFRGGPFRYADALGPAELLRRMRSYADKYGKRFAPPELLVERAASGHRFHDR